MTVHLPRNNVKIDLDLGRGTQIRLSHFREMSELADGSGLLPVDYQFLARGTLSRYQIKKRLNRFMVGLLREFIVKKNESATLSQHEHAARDRAWIRSHIKVLLSEPAAHPEASSTPA